MSYWPDKVDSLSVRGIPDRIGCVNGTYVALEFKRSLGEAKKRTGRIALQKHNIFKICQAGGFARLVYPGNWQKVFREIKKL